MNVRIEPEAAAELQEAMGWYDERLDGLGLRLLTAVDSAIERIAERQVAFPASSSGGSEL